MPTFPDRRRSLLLLVCVVSVLGLLPLLHALAWTNGQAASLVLGQRTFTTKHATDANVFQHPFDVAVDLATGKVFVADGENHRVLRFASQASLSNGLAAEAVLGQPDFTSAEPATSARGMNVPFLLALDPHGHLWVVDRENHRVLRFDNAVGKPNGAPADGVLGQPDFTSGSARTGAQGLGGPAGLVPDASGRLWVADAASNRVLRFDNAASKPNGAPADGVLGQPDFTSTTFQVSDHNMDVPTGLLADADGRLWVADTQNHRVLRFDNAAGRPNGAAADGVLGQPDFTSRAFATSAYGLSVPNGVAVDSGGWLWVADSNNQRVLLFDPAGSPTSTPTTSPTPTSTPPPALLQRVHLPFMLR